jgi:hypothetical protein
VPKPLAVALMSMFPRNGAPDPADDENYELALDEATGFYGMRRKVDAPPLVLPPAPAVMDIHEQILAEQADRVAFCAAVAPMIPMAVPIFSAVTSMKFASQQFFNQPCSRCR